MTHGKAQKKSDPRLKSSGPIRPAANARSAPPTVSARWILGALAIAIPAAALCTWLAFCLLFWQGSWQLLYHPAAVITRTPASVRLKFDAVGFATTETGSPQLQGWWVPASRSAKYTVLYLHDQSGNLSNTVDELARLHETGVNVFAFDYLGYGQSQFAHPSEAQWRKDAALALAYLTGTRHLDPKAIVLVGRGLGADLALEIGAAHPELAGAVLESPVAAPADVIFNDGRAALVPAHLLVRDRWNVTAAAGALRIPSLWLVQDESGGIAQAFNRVSARKTRIRLPAGTEAQKDIEQSLSAWISNLQDR